MTWNVRGQVTALSSGAGFAYDGLGRRRSKSISGIATNLLFDEHNLVQELSSGGIPTANVLTGLSIDEDFARAEGGGTRSILSDALGSTVALTDSSGTTQTTYTYEPFGATSTSGTASTNTAQFTGRENDGTGLYYYRARYYSPVFQRFVSEDPGGFINGPNLNEYVNSSPINFVDPFGLDRKNPFPGGVPPGRDQNRRLGGCQSARSYDAVTERLVDSYRSSTRRKHRR